MTWKRWSILPALAAALSATLTSPVADAQVASTFGFTRTPASGPAGTPIVVNGFGCGGTNVTLTVVHSSGGGSLQTFNVPVGANGAWQVRPLNFITNFNRGRFNLAAHCDAPGNGQSAFSSFDVTEAASVRPDPVARSSPSLAAVRGSNRLDVVVRDGANAVQWSTNTGAGWSAYTSLGSPAGGVMGDPSIVSWAPGRLDLFVQGSDNKLWQRFSTNGGTTWSAWIQPVGADGTLASGPKAMSRGAGLLDVFVTGTDGAVYQRFWDGRQWNGTWLWLGAPGGGTPNPPGGSVGAPSAVSANGVNVDLLARDTTDHIYRKEWNGSAWSDWHQPVGLHTGITGSRPEIASWGPGHLSTFVRGTDGWMYHSFNVDGSWLSFQSAGFLWEKIESGPAVASRGAGRMDIVARGTDDRLYHWTIG